MVSEKRSGLYSQSDYDCQKCGAPETKEMRKAVRDFIIPHCEACLEAMNHEGHRPDSTVSVVHVVVAVGLDGKREEKVSKKTVLYKDWDWRCRKCVP